MFKKGTQEEGEPSEILLGLRLRAVGDSLKVYSLDF